MNPDQPASEPERGNEQPRQQQQALIQQERLRALTQMAIAIAHDINNAISPISLYADILLDSESSLSPSGRAHLETIRSAIDHVARTMARMQDFYRPHVAPHQTQDIEINSLVLQAIELTRARRSELAQAAGATIEVRTQLATGLPPVRGAEKEIRDALTNLILNALDAVAAGGGAIEVRTAVSTLAGPGGESTSAVRLEVIDTGIGMDEATRQRCLEPFFSTKAERGTGLGLAVVYGMAQRHRATLQIESERGRGTTIRLDFPSSDNADAHVEECTPPHAPSRSLRILVVDDDDLLGQSLSYALRCDGHDVTLAASGQAGIDAFKPGSFDAVVTDLEMAGVDGGQVARVVRAAAPTTPIILLTGWGRSLRGEGPPPYVDRILEKPPRMDELRAALAELTAPYLRCNP